MQSGQQENTNTAPAPTKTTPGLAIAGLILGIVGMLFSFIPIVNFFALFPALLAFVFGLIVLFQKNVNKGMAIASVIMSIITVIIVVATNYLAYFALNQFNDSLEKTNNSRIDRINKALDSIDKTVDELESNSTDKSQDMDTSDNNKSNQKSDKIVEKNGAKIEIGEFRADADARGLSVTVTNQTSKTKSFIIGIDSYDKDGVDRGKDVVNVLYLPAGQSKKVKFFQHVSDEVNDKIKDGYFKVDDVRTL